VVLAENYRDHGSSFLDQTPRLLRLVKVQNYLCRDVQNVHTGAYLEDWFGPLSDRGLRTFGLPAISLREGVIQFINRRHRTAVLIEHLEILPMALVDAAGVDEALFNNTRYADLNLEDAIEIPDLLILTESEPAKLVDRGVPRVATPDFW
jgi:hypothetical protein